MCGLYGVYSQQMTNESKNLYQRLAYYSLVRGMHATGTAMVRSKTVSSKRSGTKKIKRKRELSTWWYKVAENAGMFFMRPRFIKEMRDPSNIVLMGHNRFATIGDDDDVLAAHPFSHGDIIGCHNGTIKDWRYAPDEVFKSDSDHLFFNINKDGLEQTAQDLRTGVFAITYIDQEAMTLNLVKNTMLRDLYYVWDIKRTTMMWASEKEFLEDTITNYSKRKWGSIQDLGTDVLYKIDLSTKKVTSKEVDFTAPFPGDGVYSKQTTLPTVVEKINPPHLTSVPTHTPMGDITEDTEADVSILSHEHYPLITFYKHPTNESKMVEYSDGCDVPMKVYEKLVNRGCGLCMGPADVDEHVVWVDSTTFLHHECHEDPAYINLTQ